MFNFFKKNEPEIEEVAEHSEDEDISATITYFIKQDGSPYVNINIKELDEENMLLLTDLLIGVSTNEYITDTIEMVRDHLVGNNRLDLYIPLAAKIANTVYTQESEEEPCIKPSDAI